jgi:hypothetical protein
MTCLIYVNLNKIQTTIYDSIYQSIKIQPDLQVFVILEQQYISTVYNTVKKYNVNVVCIPIEILKNKRIKSLDNYLKKFDLKSFRNGFWENTIKRFVYIDSLIDLFVLTNVYHIENDVMIYHPLQELQTNKIVLLKDSPNRVIGSIMYIKQDSFIKDLTDYIIKQCNSNIFKNDMEILGNYPNANYFNTDPKDGIIYDGACLGQFLGGIDYRNIQEFNNDKGVLYNNGYAGFINETSDFKPDQHIFTLKNGRYRVDGQDILNLHIHNKQLYNFSSFKINFNQIITGDRVLTLCDYTFSTNDIYSFHKGISDYAQHIFIIDSFEDVNVDLINKTMEMSDKTILNLFIYTHILENFIKSILPKLDKNKKYNIYLHNSDHPFDSQYSQLLNDNRINKVFAQNANVVHEKVILLPIGIANSMWKHGDLYKVYDCIIQNYKLKKTKNVYININPGTFAYRQELLNEIKNQDGVCSSNKEYSEYLLELASHYFCLCPRGNGIESHRFWESIYLGVVPVIINNKSTKCDAFVQNLYKLNIPFYEIRDENIKDIISKVMSLTYTDFEKYTDKNWLISLEQFKE